MTDDEFNWKWHEMQLRLRLSEIDGVPFEDLAQAIFKELWGSDFQGTIPMGSRGDLKCDGFRHSTGCVYQCYGPRYGQANVSDGLAKIDEDFRGAKGHWKTQMQKWTFVIGLYQDRVPSEFIRLIKKLSVSLKVPFEICGREELINLVKKTSLDFRTNKIGLGRAPLPEDMIRRVTYENIGKALSVIRAEVIASPKQKVELPPVVEEKIEFNLLPSSVRLFLGIGIAAADRVKNYLQDRADPSEAERMAEGFAKRYREVRANGSEPGEAFGEMLAFAGGGRPDPDREAAALAIVTHFFTTCEIFERPPKVKAV